MPSNADRKAMAGYVLSWKEGRRTPSVHRAGSKPPGAGGKVVKSRRATADEVAKIRKGQWLRVGKDGSKPGSSAYARKKSRVRKQPNLQPRVRRRGS